jgi:type IV pilus assembly protein PilP
MVGTLEKDAQNWGLVTAPDGAVHRIQPGNYVGKNYGKITLVAEDRIELVEIVPDGLGGWQERGARLDLSE